MINALVLELEINNNLTTIPKSAYALLQLSCGIFNLTLPYKITNIWHKILLKI